MRHGQNLSREIQQVFENKPVLEAHQGLSRAWKRHLKNKQNELKEMLRLDEVAVWSADAFYPLLLRPDFFGRLTDGHEIRLRNRQPRTRIRWIRRAPNGGQWVPLAAWDMECASVFSACNTLGLRGASALVVSWTSEHWTDIGKSGRTSRARAHKATAHLIERLLICEAVGFLLT